jgi:hypothetical protein
MKMIDISTPKYPNSFTMVDDEDFDILNKHKWHIAKNSKTWYAQRNVYKPKHGMIFLHRQILNIPDGMFIDHIDGNGLNNQKANIRVCTKAENCRNARIRGDNTSGYKGVSFHKPTKKWSASIQADKKQKHIGLFQSPQEAAFAWNIAAKEMHKDYAKLNMGVRYDG